MRFPTTVQKEPVNFGIGANVMSDEEMVKALLELPYQYVWALGFGLGLLEGKDARANNANGLVTLIYRRARSSGKTEELASAIRAEVWK